MLSLILFFLAGCTPNGTPSHVDTDTDTIIPADADTDVDTDTDTDTSVDPVGGNCGGPEPPEDSLWVCENGTSDLEGYAWPAAGAPEDLEHCLTSEGWEYELSEDGTTATLTRSDGRVFTCELSD